MARVVTMAFVTPPTFRYVLTHNGGRVGNGRRSLTQYWSKARRLLSKLRRRSRMTRAHFAIRIAMCFLSHHDLSAAALQFTSP